MLKVFLAGARGSNLTAACLPHVNPRAGMSCVSRESAQRPIALRFVYRDNTAVGVGPGDRGPARPRPSAQPRKAGGSSGERRSVLRVFHGLRVHAAVNGQHGFALSCRHPDH